MGGTDLSIENGRLVVSDVSAEGDGVGFWQNYSEVSLKITPLQLPTGGRFGTSVRDTDDRFIAGIESRDRGDQTHDIVFNVDDRFGIQFVTLQYLLGGQVVFEIPRVPIGGSGLKLRAEESAGTGDGNNGSTRVVRVGGRYVVGQDYSDENPLTTGPVSPSAEKGECPYALVTLPEIVGEPLNLCVDLVQVVIEDDGLPQDIRGVAVTGRNLGSFEITQVTARGG